MTDNTKVTVIFVDSDDKFREAAVQALSHEGYKVIAGSDYADPEVLRALGMRMTELGVSPASDVIGIIGDHTRPYKDLTATGEPVREPTVLFCSDRMDVKNAEARGLPEGLGRTEFMMAVDELEKCQVTRENIQFVKMTNDGYGTTLTKPRLTGIDTFKPVAGYSEYPAPTMTDKQWAERELLPHARKEIEKMASAKAERMLPWAERMKKWADSLPSSGKGRSM